MDLREKSSYNESEELLMVNEEIAYQNKDITSKLLAENFKGKTFKVYGLDLPEVTSVQPTNIPVIKANELRLDNLFGLADETVAIVDYESEYKKAHKVKYLNYLTGIANRYLKEKQECPKLRMIVIYTGDIQRKEVSDEYDIGALNLQIESAFLSELDSANIYDQLAEKVRKKQELTDEEMMQFIILPLSYKAKEDKKSNLDRIIDMAKRIEDKEQQLFVLSGILTFTDKIIDMEMAEKIREAIKMTQVARIFEEEKREAVTQVAKIFEKEKREAMTQIAKQCEEEKREAVTQIVKQYEAEKLEKEKQYEEEKRLESKQMVIKMLRKNYPPEEIESLVTGYTVEQIEKIRAEI